MENAESLLKKYGEKTGWAGYSIPSVLYRYIDGQSNLKDFEKFLQEQVKEEQELTKEVLEDEGPRVIAHFTPQSWVRDIATEIDGDKNFDCTVEILRLPYETLVTMTDDSYESDDLCRRDDVLGNYSGPFFVTVSEALDNFFELIFDEKNPYSKEAWDTYRKERLKNADLSLGET